jgi:hypothetical protein
MKFRQIAIAAALIALGVTAGIASPQPTQAQSGGQWQAAGSYPTAEGGEVWMVNAATGQGRNCWWTSDLYGERHIICATSRN